MGERALGRDVVSRHRFARFFSIGDRRNPNSWTPGLILSEEDQDLPLSFAPFSLSRNTEFLPAKSVISTRSNLCFPFDSLDRWEMDEGLILPPSLVESDSGEFGDGIELLPISWNSLHHDERITAIDFQPSMVVLTDSLIVLVLMLRSMVRQHLLMITTSLEKLELSSHSDFQITKYL